MRAVIQRVASASVEVEGATVGQIGRGLLVLLGVAQGDGKEDCDWLAQKVAELRIFPGDDGKMDRSVEDVNGSVLVVSQFTLYGDCRKGRRPNFTKAARPGDAEGLYREFVKVLDERGVHVEEGRFGAMMDVSLTNDGPVTLILESSAVEKP